MSSQKKMCCSPNLQYLTLSPYIEIGSSQVLLVKMTYWSRTYPLTGVFMRRRPHVKTYMGRAMAKAEAGVMQRGMPEGVSKPQELRGDQKDSSLRDAEERSPAGSVISDFSPPGVRQFLLF